LNKKQLIIIILSLTLSTLIPMTVQAAEITACTFNKTTYNQGDTGYITVTIYNDKDTKIRVTELTASIDYYYDNGNTYIQTFYYPTADLPVEIQQGQTEDLHLSFNLPNNIASGYTTLLVKAKTEQWNNNSELWFASDHTTFQPTLYLESPYKELFENQQTLYTQLQQQYKELQAINATTTNVMYILVITTMVFLAMTIFLTILKRKPKALPQPTP